MRFLIEWSNSQKNENWKIRTYSQELDQMCLDNVHFTTIPYRRASIFTSLQNTLAKPSKDAWRKIRIWNRMGGNLEPEVWMINFSFLSKSRSIILVLFSCGYPYKKNSCWPVLLKSFGFNSLILLSSNKYSY